jgi:PAS domain S-box-containing protein
MPERISYGVGATLEHEDPEPIGAMRRAARALGAAAAAIGALAIAGWGFDAQRLTSVLAGRGAITASAAVALLLCGVALSIDGERSHTGIGRGARLALPALAVGLGLFSLREDASTGLGLVLIGSSLLLLASPEVRPRRAAQVLAIAVLVIAYLAVIGHALGVKSVDGFSPAQMALPSVAGFVLLSIGICCADPTTSLMAPLRGRDAGGILFRRLVPVVVAMPLGIGWLRLHGEQSGLYAREVGVGVMVLTANLALVAVVCWTARALSRLDQERSLAHSALQRTNEQLEQRVDARTRELLDAIASMRTEVDERQRAEQAARESELKLRAVTETAHDSVVSLASDGTIQYVNPATEGMFGHAAREMVGRSFSWLVPERCHGAYRDILARCLAPDASDTSGKAVELVGRRRDGREFPVELSLGRWSLGRDTFLTVIVRDITERKELQTRVLLSDRMASVGTLAAGVAHEINNPLTYIIGNVELIERRMKLLPPEPPLAPIQHAFGQVKDGALRVRDIVTKLRHLTRAEEEERHPVDLRTVADSAINIVWHELKHRARLVKRYGDVLPVLGNAARLGQVLVNLLVNAAQAIHEGHAERNEIAVSIEMRRDRVVVAIRDTGCGIEPDALARIFDPFFTTKPIGVGTGLGLSICHNIVHAAGGEIEVDTAPGSGSCFRVLLPAVRAEAPVEVEPPPPPPAARRGRILVVDDEPGVASLCERALESAHEVVVSNSGKDALECLAVNAPFDLILCDLMMPEMTGMELHAELQRIAPALAARMVFVTGGAFTATAREFLERSANPALTKPFSVDQLLGMVDHVLAEPAPWRDS